MALYELSQDAEKDLQEVARYTLHKWGVELFNRYREGLKEAFTDISSEKVAKRTFSKNFPDLFVTKYRYHYIFYIAMNRKKPIIIGVIHEKRDIVNWLNERLGS